MCCFFLITVGECNHPIQQLKTRVNTNRRILQGILAHFFGLLPTRLAVLLFHECTILYFKFLWPSQVYSSSVITYELCVFSHLPKNCTFKKCNTD